jgi:hypothetical protein
VDPAGWDVIDGLAMMVNRAAFEVAVVGPHASVATQRYWKLLNEAPLVMVRDAVFAPE